MEVRHVLDKPSFPVRCPRHARAFDHTARGIDAWLRRTVRLIRYIRLHTAGFWALLGRAAWRARR
jgi:hypothetical protein